MKRSGTRIISGSVKYILSILLLTISLYSENEEFTDSDIAAFNTDSSIVDLRSPSENDLDYYRNNSEFQYNIDKDEASESIFTLFRKWIGNLIRNIFRSADGGVPGYLFFGGLILLVIALIYIIFRSRLGNFFSISSTIRSVDINLLNDDIEGIDFESLLEKAIRSGDFRSAVRIKYLMTLKTLSENGIINWAINKTNSEYKYEIKDMQVRNKFSEITNFYEAVWYGDFLINDKVYNLINGKYSEFNNTLGSSV